MAKALAILILILVNSLTIFSQDQQEFHLDDYGPPKPNKPGPCIGCSIVHPLDLDDYGPPKPNKPGPCIGCSIVHPLDFTISNNINTYPPPQPPST